MHRGTRMELLSFSSEVHPVPRLDMKTLVEHAYSHIILSCTILVHNLVLVVDTVHYHNMVLIVAMYSAHNINRS
jgi:hypothetical protein